MRHNAASDNLQTGAHALPRPEFQNLAHSVQQQCTATISRIARQRNAVVSCSSRIPPELWSMIWCLLPQQDVLDVARVCHTWRQTALGDARLWTRCDVRLDLPDPRCRCHNYCEDLSDDDSDFTPDRDLWGDDSVYDLVAIEEQLGYSRLYAQRSRGLPLSITLAVGHETPHPRVIPSLFRTLSAHARRIRVLRLDFDSLEVMKSLLRRFAAFPALHDLSISCTDETHEDMICMSLVPFPAMPCLRTFEVVTPLKLEFLDERPGRNLGSVKTLTTHLTGLASIASAMGSCPQLSVLRAELHMGGALPGEMHLLPRVAAWIGGLSEVRLKYDEGYMDAVRGLVAASANVVRLEVHFDNYDPRERPIYAPFTAEQAEEPFIILGHLAGAARLQWTLDDDSLTVVGRDSQARYRRACVQHVGPHLHAILEKSWSELRGTGIETIDANAEALARHILRTAPTEFSGERLKDLIVGVTRIPERGAWPPTRSNVSQSATSPS